MTEEKLFFIVMTDVSEERARQERLYLTDRLASVGEMASGIAHELNNPLTSVIALSEMLVEESVPDHIKEDLSAINSEAKRAAVIVKNMLSFARKRSPQKQFTHINKIVEDVLKLRTHEHRVTNISVVCALAPDLPEIMVDFSQIQQVFINIILNAEQAMVVAHGKGTLIISTERAGNNVKVSFTDDGPGIETQYLHRIFDPFFTTKEIGKGTGLGLSISYGIVTAHNGLIYAKSEIGKGAAFVVELPIQTTTTEGE
jgi:signal transduction histidine kinase